MIPYLLASAGSALANHLWQSTVFAAAVWLMTLLLRRNHARIRYALWFAASLKFLLPFSLLIALGTLLPQPQRVSTPSQQTMYTAIDTVGQPFSNLTPTIAPILTTSSPKPPILPLALTAAWLCGAALLLLVWYIRWHQLSATLRISTPSHHGREHDILRRLELQTNIRKPITIKLSKDPIEPGIAGILRPTLLWPKRLSEHLEDRHIEAIIAHELIHVRRRDNLTAAIHMLVEALFWFHPLVWWIEKRMLEERERSCDEAVVQMGSKPGTYAESLLKACRFCLESPLPCVSGITGSDLNQRVRSIMSLHRERLSTPKRLLLVTAIIAAAAIPITFGQIDASVQAQAAATDTHLTFEAATIKPGTPRNGYSSWSSGGAPGGQFQIINMPLKQWVELGLSIPDYALKAPSWLDTARFDLNARMPIYKQNGHIPTPEMMKALLIERFGLKWHEESQVLPGYELVPDKKVLVKPTGLLEQLHSHGMGWGPTVINGKNMTMSELAETTEKVLGKPVVDATHLSGKYDIDLRWRALDNAELEQQRHYGKQYGFDVDSLPSTVFSAMQEKLGLLLQSAKVPTKIIVIDSINHQPTEN